MRQKLFFASTDEFDVTSFVISYTYRLLVASTQLGSEVVSFHWTPDAEPPQRTYPHIHVGSVVTRGSSYRPKDFNRLHIPTGSVSLDAVLLFAVEELGVEPKPGRSRDDVLATLREGERWFRAVASTAEDR